MVAVRKDLEGKARNLGDDVINARLAARSSFVRDVILEFVEQVAGPDVMSAETPGLWERREASGLAALGMRAHAVCEDGRKNHP